MLDHLTGHHGVVGVPVGLGVLLDGGGDVGEVRQVLSLQVSPSSGDIVRTRVYPHHLGA